MGKFIIVSFLALGLAFYQFSGGADFVPQERVVAVNAPITTAVRVGQTTDASVSRSNAASLIALNPAVTTVSLETTAPVAEPTVAVVAIVEETPTETVAVALDIRAVAGTRVNMRQGPGTSFDVLDTLDGGTQTEVLEVNADGWARIEVLNTGQTGWMSERLLTDG
jgi:uncharacterized protein YgiM (DUF1202 family)